MLVRVGFTLVHLLIAFALNAQVVGLLVFNDSDLTQECYRSKSRVDTLSAYAHFSRCIANLHGRGYLEARVDSLSITPTHLMAYGHLGKIYHWASIDADSVSQQWLRSAGLRPSHLLNQPISPESVSELMYKATAYLENNGFPFASIELLKSEIQGNQLHSELKVYPGPLIRLDTLYLLGDAKISQRFVERHLGFRKDAPYSESHLAAFNSRLQSLPYIKAIRPVEVEFIPGRARVYSYLTNQQANQFSGLLGFISTPDQNPRIRFTGDLNLQLLNIFGRGESNSLQWQALDQGLQRLKIASRWHYIFGSSVGISTYFNLFRRDTSYVNLNPKVDITFPFSRGSASLGFDYRSTNALAAASGVGNSSTMLYTSSLSLGSQVYIDFPVKALWVKTAIGVGQRSEKNDGNEQDLSSVVGEFSGEIVGYFPLYHEHLVFKASLQGQWLTHIMQNASSSGFFENELYRIGGFGSLRGFNQESIITSAYAISKVELQLRIDRAINTFLFYDQGILSGYGIPNLAVQMPYGVGFGFQLASMGSLFSMSYALGNGMGEHLSFKNAKLHLGVTAKF